MSDEDYISWTGWNKEQFQDMFGYFVEMHDSSNRDKRTALAMFWVKLKTGLSFGQMCSLFNLHPVQQNQRVADAVHTISEQLAKFFVPEHLGVESLTMYSMKSCICYCKLSRIPIKTTKNPIILITLLN